MRRTTLITILLALLSATGTAGAGPLQSGEIEPGANWVVHVNVEAFRESALGRAVLPQLMNAEVEQKLQSFATIFSFHPLNDVRDVTLYGKGQDRHNAVAIVEGRFDKEKLLALIRLGAQYQEMAHKGTTFYRWLQEDEKEPQKAGQLVYGSFCGDDQVMISTGLETLKRGLDTIQGAPNAEAGLLARIPEAQGSAFVQAVAMDVGRMAGQEPKAAVLKQTESLGLAIGANDEKAFAELHLRGESAEVAESMTKMIQGLIALAELSGNEQPQLSELARHVAVSRTDKTTRIRLALPAQTIVNFVKHQWKQKGQEMDPTQAP